VGGSTSRTGRPRGDANDGLEVYLNVPGQQEPLLKGGLPVRLVDDRGQLLATNTIGFVSPNVDTATQTVLAKTPLVDGRGQFRADQFVRARKLQHTIIDRGLAHILAVPAVVLVEPPRQAGCVLGHAVLGTFEIAGGEPFEGIDRLKSGIGRQHRGGRSSRGKQQLFIGPWLHGGWASMPGDALGDIRFGSPTGDYYRREIELPFFTYHLKDQGPAPTAEATVFETGRNTWRTFDTWPPSTDEMRSPVPLNGT